MITIVQIDTVPVLALRPRDGFDLDLQAESNAESVGYAAIASEDGGKHKKRVTNFSVILTDGMDDADHVYRQLVYYTGKVVDLIGYTSFGCGAEQVAVWLENRGVVAKVQRRGTQQGDMTLSVNVELLHGWQPLNRLVWQYGAGERYPLDAVNLAAAGFNVHEVYPGFMDFSGLTLSADGDSSYSVQGANFAYGCPHIEIVGSDTLSEDDSGLYIGGDINAMTPEFSIPVQADTTYTFSFWARALDIRRGNTIGADLLVDDGSVMDSMTPVMLPARRWRHVRYTFTTGVGMTEIGLTVRKAGVSRALVWEIAGLSLIEGDRFYDRRLPSYPLPFTGALQSAYPTLDEVLSKRGENDLFIRRRLAEPLMYNPDNWPLVVDNLPPNYPTVGRVRTWDRGWRGQRMVWRGARWNYPPLAVYALRGLTVGMRPAIRVSRPGSVGVTNINCAVLGDVLNARTAQGLQTTDVLLVGEFTGRALVVRNGQPVTYVTESLATGYDTDAPGGVLHDDFAAYVNAGGGEWAALWLWRLI